jgi:protein-S-isoprenylcysteine O-methyltransferase
MTPFNPQLLGPIYGLSEFALLLAKRSRASAASHDRGSLGLLWVVILGSIGLAVAFGILFQRADSELLLHLAPVAGALFIGGLVLRWYSIFYLGPLFTVNVAIADDHRLIDTGPYKYIRHPSYAGALLAFLGLGISFGNWLSLLVILVPTTLAFMHRIAIEETALGEALGESYMRYTKRTKRLIPFVY